MGAAGEPGELVAGGDPAAGEPGGGRDAVVVVTGLVGTSVVGIWGTGASSGRRSIGRTVGGDSPSVRAKTAASPKPMTAAIAKTSANVAARPAPERRGRAGCAAATFRTVPRWLEPPVRSA
jgi:hypothetical protein